MSRWTLVWLALSVITGVLGFGGMTSSVTGLAQILFGIFLALLLISLVAGLVAQADDRSNARD
ncbi:DUF1328 domain-containing protein [Proteobacteria bacterium 005FR1]|nr:DUF1328 domain-containing protein [Proteobacteria bacterium 005FR1]